MDERLGELLVAVITLIGSVFGAVKFGEGRGRKSVQADMVETVVNASKIVIDSRGDEITRQGHEIKKLRVDLDVCENRHNACEERVDALAEELSKYATKAEIDDLMKGPVAGYVIGSPG